MERGKKRQKKANKDRAKKAKKGKREMQAEQRGQGPSINYYGRNIKGGIGAQMAGFGRFPEKLREPPSTCCAKCCARPPAGHFKEFRLLSGAASFREHVGASPELWFEAILVAEFRRKVAVF
jgi:hypothetical protein